MAHGRVLPGTLKGFVTSELLIVTSECSLNPLLVCFSKWKEPCYSLITGVLCNSYYNNKNSGRLRGLVG